MNSAFIRIRKGMNVPVRKTLLRASPAMPGVMVLLFAIANIPVITMVSIPMRSIRNMYHRLEKEKSTLDERWKFRSH
jgi:hypothetical protein